MFFFRYQYQPKPFWKNSGFLLTPQPAHSICCVHFWLYMHVHLTYTSPLARGGLLNQWLVSCAMHRGISDLLRTNIPGEASLPP